MEIRDHDMLTHCVIGLPHEDAKKLIAEYGNARAEKAIEDSWIIFRKILKHVDNSKKKRFRREILDFDEFTSMISLVSFTKWFAAIEDKMLEYSVDGCEETQEAMRDVNALMYQTLGDMKIDRRLIYTKD